MLNMFVAKGGNVWTRKDTLKSQLMIKLISETSKQSGGHSSRAKSIIDSLIGETQNQFTECRRVNLCSRRPGGITNRRQERRGPVERKAGKFQVVVF